MKRTKEDAETTRKNLIKVGVDVFRMKSYAATRLSDVAKAAGVTRGAIYHHFGSKEELFKAIAIEHRDVFNDVFIDNPDIKGKELIKSLKDSFIRFFYKLEDDEYFRHFMEILIKTDIKKELPDVAEILGENKQVGHGRTQLYLDKAKAEGAVDPNLDTSMFAFFMMSATFGILSIWLENQNLISIKEEAQKFADFIFARLEK